MWRIQLYTLTHYLNHRANFADQNLFNSDSKRQIAVTTVVAFTIYRFALCVSNSLCFKEHLNFSGTDETNHVNHASLTGMYIIHVNPMFRSLL